jgi:hypothetical protein
MKTHAPRDSMVASKTLKGLWWGQLLSVQVIAPLVTLVASVSIAIVAGKMTPKPPQIRSYPRIVRRIPRPLPPEIEPGSAKRPSPEVSRSTSKIRYPHL